MGRKRVMIVGDITRFTNKGMGLAMRVLAAGLAALLALTFFTRPKRAGESHACILRLRGVLP